MKKTIYACKSDVFKGDIIRHQGKFFVVIDSMNSNNGNFRAKDSRGRLFWLNTLNVDGVKKRKDQTIIYI